MDNSEPSSTLVPLEMDPKAEPSRFLFPSMIPQEAYLTGQFLSQPKPSWHDDISKNTGLPQALDLTKVYKGDEYWQNQVKGKKWGMPTLDSYWCYHTIANSKTLASLNISRCNIGDAGLATLTHVMMTNDTLTSLNISDNSLSYECLHRFVVTMNLYNFTLTSLAATTNQAIFNPATKEVEFVPLQVMSDLLLVLGLQELISAFLKRNAIFHQVRNGESDGLVLPQAMLAASSMNRLFKVCQGRLNRLVLKEWFPQNVATIARWSGFPKDFIPEYLNHEYDKLPEAMSDLVGLQTLQLEACRSPKDVSDTFFLRLPPSFANLRHLKTLIVKDCGLLDVDAEDTLGFSGSRFSTMSSVFSSFLCLNTLVLDNNKLKRLPDAIGSCSTLTKLSLVNNELESLPDSILLLSNLKQLWAWNNRIWRYPLMLPVYCPLLEDLRMMRQGSTGKEPLPLPGAIERAKLRQMMLNEAVSVDNDDPVFEDILVHLKSLIRESNQVPTNRFKLVFVGDGAVGKTTTVRALHRYVETQLTRPASSSSDNTVLGVANKLKSILSSSETVPSEVIVDNILDNVATDGVEITYLKVPSGKKKGVKKTKGNELLFFSCWDFAGQDVYTYSHTFFLTRYSVYFVTFDCSLGDTSQSIERADYWLQTIRTRFPQAHCVLVGTHCDKLTKEELMELETAIMSRYNVRKEKNGKIVEKLPGVRRCKVANVIFMSNLTGRGIPELIEELRAAPETLAKLGLQEEIPFKWLWFEERGKSLRALRTVPLIPWFEWKDFAWRELEMNEEEVRKATNYWNEIGTLTWFNEDRLRHMVCLRPSFLADVFAAVISAKIGLNSSILRTDALHLIWKGLPTSLFPYLLDVLQRFEIVFKLDDKFFSEIRTVSPEERQRQALGLPPSFGGFSVVPAMLPEQEPPPELLSVVWPPTMRDSTDYVRNYTFDFVPNGFFSRILVRLLQSKWRASLWWRNGIILYKKMARMFLRYDPPRRNMTLHVRGPESSLAIGALIDSISTLIHDWLPEAKVIVSIPYLLSDGKTNVRLLWSDLEEALIEKRQTHYRIPEAPVIEPPVRLDALVPELLLMEKSTTIYPLDELVMEQTLGRGGFALVSKARMKSTGQEVACKQLLSSLEEAADTSATDARAEFRREVWLMSSLAHENLVRLVGICTVPELVMILEYMDGGDLLQYLIGNNKGQEPAKLTTDDRFSLALGIANGMKFMHNQNPPIVHRDLKSPNILLTFKSPTGMKLKTPMPKIADFGLCRGLVWSPSLTDKAVENPTWLAPEVLLNQSYNEKVDVYAFGVILYEICVGDLFLAEVPFYNKKEEKIKAGYRPALPADLDPVLKSLIEQCWAQDAARRPSFSQIVDALQHRTFITSPEPSRLVFGTGWEDFDTPADALLKKKEAETSSPEAALLPSAESSPYIPP